MVVVAIQRWNAGHARTSFPRGEAPDVVLTTTPPYFLAGAIGHGSVPAPTDAGVLPCLPCPALPSCPALPCSALRGLRSERVGRRDGGGTSASHTDVKGVGLD